MIAASRKLNEKWCHFVKKVFELKIALIGHVTKMIPQKIFKVLQLPACKYILSLLHFMLNSSKVRPPPYFLYL